MGGCSSAEHDPCRHLRRRAPRKGVRGAFGSLRRGAGAVRSGIGGCGELGRGELAREGDDDRTGVGGVLPGLALEAVIVGRLGGERGEVDAALFARALAERVAAHGLGTNDAQW